MFKLLFNDLFRHSDFLEEIRNESHRILIHSRLGKIEFQKKRNNRHIRISLRHDASVLVTLPVRCSFAEADRFLCSKIEWITAAQTKLKERGIRHKKYTDEEINLLRLKAKNTLPQRTAELAARHGFQYLKVAVKRMRTRWGSCSVTNKINLSIFLMNLPAELVDYVILHELCHTIHKNHAAQFWTLLDTVTQGQARVLEKQMKQHTIDIW